MSEVKVISEYNTGGNYVEKLICFVISFKQRTEYLETLEWKGLDVNYRLDRMSDKQKSLGLNILNLS